MNQRVPKRHGKGAPDGGRLAPDETPTVKDTGSLILEDAEVVVDPVADLYDKMTYGADGFDGQGNDRVGFNRRGWHLNGTVFDDAGYDWCGYDGDGYHRRGFNRAGKHRNGTDYNDFDGWGWGGHGTSRS